MRLCTNDKEVVKLFRQSVSALQPKQVVPAANPRSPNAANYFRRKVRETFVWTGKGANGWSQ